jgi:hypothetical protein
MNGYLRQSTASQARAIGPFVDDTDFKTAETGLTIANTDVILRANGTSLSTKNSGGGTHQANGVYSLTFDATDTANVGELFYSVVVAGALPVFGTYVVLEEAAYDMIFAASAPGDSAGVTTLLGRLTSTRAGYLDNLSAGAVALEASLQGLITTIGASAAGVASAVWSAVSRVLTSGANIALAKGTGVTGFNDLSAAQVNAEADTAIADAALATASSVAAVASAVATVSGFVDTEVAAIKVKTDKLTFDGSNRVASNVQAINSVTVDGAGTSGDPWGPV